MRPLIYLIILLSLNSSAAALEPEPVDYFAKSVRPVLVKFCAECHDDKDSKKLQFLKSMSPAQVAESRGMWRKVALQLRNRTMPPSEEPQPSEEDRFRISTWIETHLRTTACQSGEYAGSVVTRRLNRNEYENTVRDLIGLKMNFSETFPIDGSGGEGFDNNGETLFLSPLLMERYLEAAQTILDSAIITPPIQKSYNASDLLPPMPEPAKKTRLLKNKDEASTLLSVYLTGDYIVKITATPHDADTTTVALKIDNITAHHFSFEKKNKNNSQQTVIRLTRGLHALSLRCVGKTGAVSISKLRVTEKRKSPTDDKKAIHKRLFSTNKGMAPRVAAKTILSRFAKQAFRHPVHLSEVDRFLTLYDRAAERNDPHEEAIKLALKAILVSPDFLLRIEGRPAKHGIQPITNHELATRLSYFLWSSMPDAELTQLADEEKLQAPEVLITQIDRMLADEKSHAFTQGFLGQWLGTKDVGGRVAPITNEIQTFYTPDLVTDLKQEAVLLFDHVVREDRSLLELINADYTFLTGRLARHYGIKNINGNQFRKVALKDNQRGGLLGLGAVLAMTSNYKQTSPVLRGAWVLETLLGTPVPSPPPDIPPLKKGGKQKKLTTRQILQAHREHASCAACHDLIDPIGFGLENYDYLGRWREKDKGLPVDATGKMPSGETFNGPRELKQLLLRKKQEFTRQISRKLLGYALGRGLVDADQCTIEKLVSALGQNDYRAQTLIKTIVLSTPFRYHQRIDRTNKK